MLRCELSSLSDILRSEIECPNEATCSCEVGSSCNACHLIFIERLSCHHAPTKIHRVHFNLSRYNSSDEWLILKHFKNTNRRPIKMRRDKSKLGCESYVVRMV